MDNKDMPPRPAEAESECAVDDGWEDEDVQHTEAQLKEEERIRIEREKQRAKAQAKLNKCIRVEREKHVITKLEDDTILALRNAIAAEISCCQITIHNEHNKNELHENIKAKLAQFLKDEEAEELLRAKKIQRAKELLRTKELLRDEEFLRSKDLFIAARNHSEAKSKKLLQAEYQKPAASYKRLDTVIEKSKANLNKLYAEFKKSNAEIDRDILQLIRQQTMAAEFEDSLREKRTKQVIATSQDRSGLLSLALKKASSLPNESLPGVLDTCRDSSLTDSIAKEKYFNRWHGTAKEYGARKKLQSTDTIHGGL